MAETIYKFKLFFVGLVFAVLSFAMQNPVSTGVGGAKEIEFISWLLLIITGFIALRDCGGFSSELTVDGLSGLGKFWRNFMWISFFSAVTALFFAKAIDSIHSQHEADKNKQEQRADAGGGS